MKQIMIGAALLFAATFANAYSYGRWMCDYCKISPIGTPAAAMDLSDVTEFIKEQNTSIMNSGPQAKSPVARWQPGDLITICDGNLCLTVTYQAAGIWLPSGGTYKDNGRGYKNVNASLQSGSVGSAGSNFLLVFRDVNYSGTSSYTITRSYTIISGPVVPKDDPYTPASFGEGFSSGFSWTGGTSSDVWSAQGGTCNNSTGTCTREY